jgi:hypothetical protein
MSPTPDVRIVHTYALQGDTAKAKAAYQDFLTLWKDADPDIPIFIAAKASTLSCNRSLSSSVFVLSSCLR